MIRFGGALVLGATLSACGGAPQGSVPVPTVEAPPTAPATTKCPGSTVLVDATDLVIIGEITEAQHSIVEWALTRFDEADLRLPSEIRVSFDLTGDTCAGWPGLCLPDNSPPQIAICEPYGESGEQLLRAQIATLHELAHVWHRAQGDGSDWPDHRDIVGGELNGDDVRWQEQMKERVAVVVSWGLLDQLRRPVRSDLPCVSLYQQFVALTGHVPLEPIHDVCRP